MVKWVSDSQKDILGMARVGFVGDLEVYVNTNDSGMIPHFHLRDPNNWERFHTCIKLTKPEYFLHEGKEDTLNTKQRKELQQFMQGKITIPKYANKFDNNWQLACFMWDINNSSVEIPDGVEMPDYKQL